MFGCAIGGAMNIISGIRLVFTSQGIKTLQVLPSSRGIKCCPITGFNPVLPSLSKMPHDH